jgi:hypothetical protein
LKVEAMSDDDCSVLHDIEDASDARLQRKAAAKAAKASTRAKRECCAPPETGQKPCDTCGRGVDLLVRCKIDATQAWRMVCGKCWKTVSGGQVDGDSLHPHYRYGGLWKNRNAVGAAVRPTVEVAADPRFAAPDGHSGANRDIAGAASAASSYATESDSDASSADSGGDMLLQLVPAETA